MANTLYLRDFVFSKPLPALRIDKEDLNQYLRLTECKVSTLNGDVFYKYPKLFGEKSILRNVWFNEKTLHKVTNYYLYSLELLLENQFDDERGLDDCLSSPENATYIVSEIKSPLAMYPLSPFAAELR